jgi:hypothetical protein
MTISERQFRAQFPEFRDTAPAVVERAISDATAQIDATVWGTKTNLGIKYLAADIIASGPLGEQARLKKENRSTTYRDKYNSLMRQVAFGFRVI